MQAFISHFIKLKRINSFQKLRFLLFLHRFPTLKGTSEDFAGQLHFGDKIFVDEMITELEEVGLLKRVGYQYMLNNEPTIQANLKELARAFDHPLSRQKLLDYVKGKVGYNGRSDSYQPQEQPFTSF